MKNIRNIITNIIGEYLNENTLLNYDQLDLDDDDYKDEAY